jgi:Uma2 family endonuclease
MVRSPPMVSHKKPMGSVAVAQRRWTYRDLVVLPEDRLRHELLDGEHVVTPSPGTAHQLASRELFRLLDAHVVAHQLGEILYAPYDIKLSLFTVVVPDIVYFTAERFARVVNDRCATAAPDLVVEILSPGTHRRDKGRKRAIYEREGVAEYWIVDPGAKQVTVLHRPVGATGFADVVTFEHPRLGVLESPLLPGLRISLACVFR